MGITHYLAMTAAEFSAAEVLPPSPAWMACHFSPYGLGLSNLPQDLPTGTLLVLDDMTPIQGHDPELVAQQLLSCMEELECSGLLLDFQRSGFASAAQLSSHLSETLPFPVCVSALYGEDLTCPVLLPPLPCHVSLEHYLVPWSGREVWLETALSGEVITVTEGGSTLSALPEIPEAGFPEETLHCHYCAEILEDSLRFSLWRTPEDLSALLEEGERFGISQAVGLYQELWKQ